MIKTSFRVIGSIAFAFLGLWLGYKFYIEPLVLTPEFVVADPYYVMSALFGVAIGFLISLPFLWFFKFAGKEQLVIKSLCVLPLVFSLLAVGANLAIVEMVIEQRGLVQCPDKLGYKKNLLRDYVKNISLCEKF
ncbi:hypothetical protein NUE03_004193 [Vibrio vulnificus]|nr:hypothetical protein [Vibrio vulnificus]